MGALMIFTLNLGPPCGSYYRTHHETSALIPPLGLPKSSIQDPPPCCCCSCCSFFLHSFTPESVTKKWGPRTRLQNRAFQGNGGHHSHEMEGSGSADGAGKEQIKTLETGNKDRHEIDNARLEKILPKDKDCVEAECKKKLEMDSARGSGWLEMKKARDSDQLEMGKGRDSHDQLKIDKDQYSGQIEMDEDLCSDRLKVDSIEMCVMDKVENTGMDMHRNEGIETIENGEAPGSFGKHSFWAPQSSEFTDVIDSYAALLRSTVSLPDGCLIHGQIIEHGLEHLVYLSNLIVQMYSKCGSLEDSSSMFNRMQQKNKFSWTIMITAFIHHHRGKEALLLFHHLRSQGVEPDTVTCVTILSVCTNIEFLDEGKRIHTYIVSKGIEHDAIVGNALLNMYGKCGCLEDALRIFHGLPNRNTISWNALITAFAQHGKSKEALILYKEMELDGENPNLITFVSIFTACASQGDLLQAKEMHAKVASKGIEMDGVIGNALINMYNKCGSVSDAWIVFDQMKKRNVVTWNAMVGAYAEHGLGHMSFSLFQQMISEGIVPDKVTFISILEACAQTVLLEEGKTIHSAIIENGLESDVRIQTSLIYMYSKCGGIEDARREFDRMLERDVVAWNAMIEAYVEQCQCDTAFTMFQQMQLEGVNPDTYTYVSVLDACAKKEDLHAGKKVHACLLSSDFRTTNSLVQTALLNMYGKCGNLQEAWSVLDMMSKKDAIPWNALMACYAEHNQPKKALVLFEQMHTACVCPDEATFVSVLDACGKLIAAEEGYRIHSLIVESGFEPDIIIGTALITMYGRCGCLDNAETMFNKLFERCVVSWTALITMQSQHGNAEKVLKLFSEMKREGKVPTKTTFVSVLSACSRAGLVSDGWFHFRSMSEDYGLEPSVDHYNCMIDLLSRSGHLREAEDLLSSMLVPPNATSWISLLSACKTYLDVERAERVSIRILELEPDNDSAYVLLSNIYAATGRWEDVEKTRRKMEERGLKKKPGCSSIKINDQVHTFFAGGHTHPQREKLYDELEKLSRLLKSNGYVPDTSVVLHDVTEKEKETLLSRHSEKLAMAYGIFNTPPDKPLLIVKNLRMCPDCHSAAKIISKAIGREIVLKDVGRFHHFRDGICSCSDCW